MPIWGSFAIHSLLCKTVTMTEWLHLWNRIPPMRGEGKLSIQIKQAKKRSTCLFEDCPWLSTQHKWFAAVNTQRSCVWAQRAAKQWLAVLTSWHCPGTKWHQPAKSLWTHKFVITSLVEAVEAVEALGDLCCFSDDLLYHCNFRAPAARLLRNCRSFDKNLPKSCLAMLGIYCF